MRRLLASLAFVLCSNFASANSIGNITEITGSPGTIQRSGNLLEGQANASLWSMDVLVTQNGSAKLKFVDNTRISITEQSKLVIDEYVYDPRQGDNSKLAMKVTMGTVRYASGQIAKINQQKVDLQTPTATIAVRGTDFFMTVAETGESFVVLVPSCDQGGNCRTGRIQVGNDAGMVELNEPFTATSVVSRNQAPTPPSKINISESNINNLMIVAPPPGLKGASASSTNNQQSEMTFALVRNNGSKNTNTKESDMEALPLLLTKETGTAKTNSTPIIIENSPGGSTTASRSTSGYGQSHIRFLDGSTGTVTINQGDNATTQVGVVGSNTFIIKQSP